MRLSDRKNPRTIPHRFEAVGYVPMRNPHANDGLWKVAGERQAVYVDQRLSLPERFKAMEGCFLVLDR